MNRHGSESYFVLGEGLLGEALGGRRVAAVATAADAATAPPFRFSRMGPKGTGKQLGEANRKRIAEAMTADNLTKTFGMPLIVDRFGDRFTARAT